MPEKIASTILDLDETLLADVRRLTRRRDSSAAVDAALRECLRTWDKVVKKNGGPEKAPKLGTWDGLAAFTKFVRKNGWDGEFRRRARDKK